MAKITDQEIINIAINTLRSESEAISALTAFVDNSFTQCIKLIYETKSVLLLLALARALL